jgi:hypothetical protein
MMESKGATGNAFGARFLIRERILVITRIVKAEEN